MQGSCRGIHHSIAARGRPGGVSFCGALLATGSPTDRQGWRRFCSARIKAEFKQDDCRCRKTHPGPDDKHNASQDLLGWMSDRFRQLGDVYKEDQIGDYFVPAGTEIYISAYLIRWHPALWEKPDRFNPDRFDAGQQGEMQIHLMMIAGHLPDRSSGHRRSMIRRSWIQDLKLQENAPK